MCIVLVAFHNRDSDAFLNSITATTAGCPTDKYTLYLDEGFFQICVIFLQR